MSKTLNTAAVLTAAACLGGCATGKDAVKPNSELIAWSEARRQRIQETCAPIFQEWGVKGEGRQEGGNFVDCMIVEPGLQMDGILATRVFEFIPDAVKSAAGDACERKLQEMGKKDVDQGGCWSSDSAINSRGEKIDVKCSHGSHPEPYVCHDVPSDFVETAQSISAGMVRNTVEPLANGQPVCWCADVRTGSPESVSADDNQ
ncbi:MAG: hypothetical protein AAB739_02780 [Patescibacteria group bacterium]